MVEYDYLRKTALGSVLVAATSKGLCAVILGKKGDRAKVKALRRMFPSKEVRRSPGALGSYKKEIESHLKNGKKVFSIPLDLSFVEGSFSLNVLRACKRIPPGKTVSYAELARKIGSPKAQRAVGNALSRNPVPIVIPCHRVVSSSGELAGFSGGLSLKKKLLALEGIEVERGRLKNIS